MKGQRLVYKFNNLPYTYKPGITRSFYRDRFPTPKSSLGEHEPREYKPLVPQMRISCTTTTQPFPCYIPSQGTLSSWPVHPINSPRVCHCGNRLGTSFSSVNCSSRSRVFFPFLSFSVSHGFNLHEPALSQDTNPQFVSKKIPFRWLWDLLVRLRNTKIQHRTAFFGSSDPRLCWISLVCE